MLNEKSLFKIIMYSKYFHISFEKQIVSSKLLMTPFYDSAYAQLFG